MFAECTKTSKGECLVSVLKLEKMNVWGVYLNWKRWIFAEFTKSSRGECLLSELKPEKINVCWVY